MEIAERTHSLNYDSRREICDDRTFCIPSTRKEQWPYGNRCGWPACRDFGSYTSLHFVWMEGSTRCSRRFAGPESHTGRAGNLCSGGLSPLFHRAIGGRDLLPCKPQAELFERVSAGVRLVLWRGS